jgi:hypothetical protein
MEKEKILYCRNPNLGRPARRYTDCANPTPRYSNPANSISDLFFWKLNYPLFFLWTNFYKVRTISGLIKYLTASNVSTGLSEITKLSAVLLTSASVERSFSA